MKGSCLAYSSKLQQQAKVAVKVNNSNSDAHAVNLNNFQNHDDENSIYPVGTKVWVKDDEHGFVEGEVTVDRQGASAVEAANGDTGRRRTRLNETIGVKCRGKEEVREVEIGEISKMHRGDTQSDNTALLSLDAPHILDNVRRRFSQNCIYTYTAHVLLAVNPYNDIPELYTEERRKMYRGRLLGQEDPHPYAIAEVAHRCLRRDQKDQAIVVSGESGAGKTETSKILLSYLAEVGVARRDNQPKQRMLDQLTKGKRALLTSENVADIQQRILSLNPILEAFGNAQTLRNQNSSRFGRLTQLYFDGQSGLLLEAGICSYLLERSRVVIHNSGERNFHIFYQMMSGADKKTLSKLGLGTSSAGALHLLNQGNLDDYDNSARKKQDARLFQKVMSALQQNGISEDESVQLLHVISALVHLGETAKLLRNKKCSEGESASPENILTQGKTSLVFAALNLGITNEALWELLLRKLLPDGHYTERTESEMSYIVDSLMRSLYSRLFGHIVKRLNSREEDKKVAPGSKYIGILDIYGFEDLSANSFEQLCINLANEKLQKFFVEKVLQAEQEVYRREGIPWLPIPLPDSSPVLSLLCNKGGVLSLLDDECRVRSADITGECSLSSADFFRKLERLEADEKYKSIFYWGIGPGGLVPSGRRAPLPLTRRRRILKPYGSSSSSVLTQTFIVLHYAGCVVYTVDEWLDKNNDRVAPAIEELMASSTKSLVQNLADRTTGRRRTGMFQSSSQKFQADLTVLIQELSKTNLQFIRCFAPNVAQIPREFSGSLVLQQMTESGTMELVRLMCCGYPNRVKYADIAQHFCCVLPPRIATNLNPRTLMHVIMKAYGLEEGKWQLGVSRLFLRAGLYEQLEMICHDSEEGPPVEALRAVRRAVILIQFRRAVTAVSVCLWATRFMKRRRVVTKVLHYLYRFPDRPLLFFLSVPR